MGGSMKPRAHQWRSVARETPTAAASSWTSYDSAGNGGGFVMGLIASNVSAIGLVFEPIALSGCPPWLDASEIALMTSAISLVSNAIALNANAFWVVSSAI